MWRQCAVPWPCGEPIGLELSKLAYMYKVSFTHRALAAHSSGCHHIARVVSCSCADLIASKLILRQASSCVSSGPNGSGDSPGLASWSSDCSPSSLLAASRSSSQSSTGPPALRHRRRKLRARDSAPQEEDVQGGSCAEQHIAMWANQPCPTQQRARL
eukprot:CAMPEP_0176247618 /NCGR_PEP_ID=MMETSP0121_2-20121125/33047_1 /TAXON_ID=160619 /ORGANISM="Kryptoperidinium foliaceum, Strain CCMP 1326" /LENGTH=157 /DNA_ID=CAMNT_0017587277 /DNA_START=204 /DNA_END=674 /DNA_ORIENTATION=+